MDYELPIFNESHLEVLLFEISRELILNMLKDSSDQLGILHKMTNILVQQWQHLNQFSFHFIWKSDCCCTLKRRQVDQKYAREAQELKDETCQEVYPCWGSERIPEHKSTRILKYKNA
jgi:hypothetical protein